MTKAEEILENLPSVKIGLDDHYGKQTVLNALNQALSMSDVEDSPCDHSDWHFVNQEIARCRKCDKYF
jgi:hypothetical protein